MTKFHNFGNLTDNLIKSLKDCKQRQHGLEDPLGREGDILLIWAGNYIQGS